MKRKEILENPEIFAINRLPAHSDHCYYPVIKGAEQDPVQSLDGAWQFMYSSRLSERPVDFKEDLSHFGEIQVPGHIELQGYGKPQYINTLYPWDGAEQLLPPQVPEENPVGTYVRFFDLEETPEQDEDITLLFHGVETAFSVWLNGFFYTLRILHYGYCKEKGKPPFRGGL